MSKNINNSIKNNSKKIDNNIQIRNTKGNEDVDNSKVLDKIENEKTNNNVKKSKGKIKNTIITVIMCLLIMIDFIMTYNNVLNRPNPANSVNDKPGVEHKIDTDDGKKYIVKNFDESERKFTENLLLDIIDFAEINYDLKFSKNFREEKVKNLKIAYKDIKDAGVLAQYDRVSGYICINSEDLNSKDLEKNVSNIAHELIHYISANGYNLGLVYKITIQDKTKLKGYAMNEAVTEKICIDYLLFKYTENKKETYLYTPSAYYKYGLVDMARALDLIYKNNLYLFFFTNDSNSLSKQFNDVPIVEKNCYSGSKGYENFVDDTDVFLQEVCRFGSTNLDEIEKAIKLGLRDKLIDFVDENNQERINMLLA